MADAGGMDPQFQAALEAMVAASGGKITITSGYRSVDQQAGLYAEAVRKYGEGEASNWVAPPGRSNHNRGIAADLGGDMELAHQLAPQFGLVFPMGWEPWHVEPVGARDDSDPQAYTMPFAGLTNPVEDPTLGSTPEFLAANLTNAMRNGVLEATLRGEITGEGTSGDVGVSTGVSSSAAGDDAQSRFLSFVRQHESGGNYQSPSGPGHWAGGAYQVMRDTWNNFGGFARADEAPPDVQDAFARQHLSGIIGATGSDDPGVWAAAWYLGTGGAQQWVAGGMDPNYVPAENSLPVGQYASQARAAVGV